MQGFVRFISDRRLVYLVAATLVGALSVVKAEASEINLGVIKALPVSELILDQENQPITYIDTGEIVDPNTGEVARGPHEVTFRVGEEAPFGLVINGDAVQPGAERVFQFNLTELGHRLFFPVHPAESYLDGEADFNLSIPFLYAEACPPSFSEEPSTCYKIEFTPITHLCPGGFEYTGNGTCRRNQPLELTTTCPTGFSQNGDRCTRTFDVPAEQYCGDDEYYVSNGECIKRTYTTSTSCPVGYDLVDSVCQSRSSSETTEVGNYCPEGTSYHSAKRSCEELHFSPILYQCPTGFQRNGENCSRTEVFDLDISCRSDYTRDGDKCWYFESWHADTSCPSGWVKNGYSCDYYSEASITSCPNGYTLRNGVCHQLRAKWESCPSGYTNTGSVCRRHESQDATPTCSTGYVYSASNQRCERTNTQNASPTCPAGYSYASSRSRCEKLETQSASSNFSCPSGYSLGSDNSFCERLVEPELTCPRFVDVDDPQGRGFCRHNLAFDTGRNCFYGSGTSVATGFYDPVCEPEIIQPYESTCPSGSTLLNGKCLITRNATTNYSCPSGWARNGTTCRRTVTTSNGWSCPAGWSRSGSTCSRTLTASNGWSCPSGWSRSGSTCSRTLTEDINYYCESGWSNHSSSQCRRNNYSANIGSCPSNYELKTNICVDEREQEVDWHCPSSHSLSKPNCEFYDEEPVIVECPIQAGFSPTGEGCRKIMTNEVVYYCPERFKPTEDLSQCFRETRVPLL